MKLAAMYLELLGTVFSMYAHGQCIEGDFRDGYLTPIVNGFEQCQRAIQTCTEGNWGGPFLYSTCDNPTEPCDYSPHGFTQFGFTSSVEPCTESTRTCIDGQWTGPELYDFCNATST